MMRLSRRLLATAATGTALFVVLAVDVHFGGPLSTRFDVWANRRVDWIIGAGFPATDVGAVLALPGAGAVDVPVVVAATVFLLAMRRWSMAACAALAPLAGSQLVNLLKDGFQRAYPPGDVHFTTTLGKTAWNVRNPGGVVGPAYAFPSGHTMGATLSVALVLLLVVEAWIRHRHYSGPQAWRWRKVALAAGGSVVFVTAVAMVLLQVHWVTDVVASCGLGAAIACSALWFAHWGGPSAPLDAPSGGPPMRVLGFTGMPGSGKSEAMEVARARGIPVVRMGDLIWEEVERRSLPRDAKHVGEVANAMRQTHGPDVWSKRTVERVREVAHGRPLVIIDGVRSDAEVETFRQELGGDFVLVAIHTDRHHRFERMLARGRADDPKDESVLQERDAREIGWGMAQSIALADEMLVNDAGLAEFRAEVSAMLDQLANAAR